MSGLWLGYKIDLLKNKQTKKISVSMVTQWTRGRGNKYRTEKEDEHFGRFKLFLHREINTVHEFSCKQNSVSAVVTMHKFSCMQKTLLCGRNNAHNLWRPVLTFFLVSCSDILCFLNPDRVVSLISRVVPHLHDGFPFLSHFVNLWSTYFFVSIGNELLLLNGKLLFSLNEKQKAFWISVDILNLCSFWISWNLLGWLEWEYHWFQSDRMNS